MTVKISNPWDDHFPKPISLPKGLSASHFDDDLRVTHKAKVQGKQFHDEIQNNDKPQKKSRLASKGKTAEHLDPDMKPMQNTGRQVPVTAVVQKNQDEDAAAIIAEDVIGGGSGGGEEGIIHDNRAHQALNQHASNLYGGGGDGSTPTTIPPSTPQQEDDDIYDMLDKADTNKTKVKKRRPEMIEFNSMEEAHAAIADGRVSQGGGAAAKPRGSGGGGKKSGKKSGKKQQLPPPLKLAPPPERMDVEHPPSQIEHMDVDSPPASPMKQSPTTSPRKRNPKRKYEDEDAEIDAMEVEDPEIQELLDDFQDKFLCGTAGVKAILGGAPTKVQLKKALQDKELFELVNQAEEKYNVRYPETLLKKLGVARLTKANLRKAVGVPTPPSSPPRTLLTGGAAATPRLTDGTTKSPRTPPAEKQQPEHPQQQQSAAGGNRIDPIVTSVAINNLRQRGESTEQARERIMSAFSKYKLSSAKSTRNQIRRAFRSILVKNHPDKGGDKETYQRYNTDMTTCLDFITEYEKADSI